MITIFQSVSFSKEQNSGYFNYQNKRMYTTEERRGVYQQSLHF